MGYFIVFLAFLTGYYLGNSSQRREDIKHVTKPLQVLSNTLKYKHEYKVFPKKTPKTLEEELAEQMEKEL